MHLGVIHPYIAYKYTYMYSAIYVHYTHVCMCVSMSTSCTHLLHEHDLRGTLDLSSSSGKVMTTERWSQFVNSHTKSLTPRPWITIWLSWWLPIFVTCPCRDPLAKRDTVELFQGVASLLRGRMKLVGGYRSSADHVDLTSHVDFDSRLWVPIHCLVKLNVDQSSINSDASSTVPFMFYRC